MFIFKTVRISHQFDPEEINRNLDLVLLSQLLSKEVRHEAGGTDPSFQNTPYSYTVLSKNEKRIATLHNILLTYRDKLYLT